LISFPHDSASFFLQNTIHPLYLSNSPPYLTITTFYDWYSPFKMGSPDVNLWQSAEHALDYLAKADSLPHRTEGEAELLACLPISISRVLDLGSGDGRLLALVKLARPDARAVALDFSPTMIEKLDARFAGDDSVQVLVRDLDKALPTSLGTFDAIVSSFAIHHVIHERKRSLYEEVFRLLSPGGVFCNLEHVSSPTLSLHHQFLAAINYRPDQEDPWMTRSTLARSSGCTALRYAW
jgi:tRNA (cmo5U34)-methyltransferase